MHSTPTRRARYRTAGLMDTNCHDRFLYTTLSSGPDLYLLAPQLSMHVIANPLFCSYGCQDSARLSSSIRSSSASCGRLAFALICTEEVRKESTLNLDLNGTALGKQVCTQTSPLRIAAGQLAPCCYHASATHSIIIFWCQCRHLLPGVALSKSLDPGFWVQATCPSLARGRRGWTLGSWSSCDGEACRTC